MNLTRHLKYGLYNILKSRNQKLGSYLPLYSSTVFKENTLEQSLRGSIAARRYKEILPSILLGGVNIWEKKYIAVKLQFNPEAETLKILSLRANGFLNQQFHIDNIIPWSYPDMMASSKWPEPTLPTFLDDEMLYFNKILKEVLMFERDGKWHETVNHPKLSLQARANERDWLDNRRII